MDEFEKEFKGVFEDSDEKRAAEQELKKLQ